MIADSMRKELINLIYGVNAHMSFTMIVQDFPVDKINSHIDDVPYTPWQVVEHMRLTLHDILSYIRDDIYKEPVWPDDYWPPKETTATAIEWNRSVNHFMDDLEALVAIINDPRTELTAPLAHNADHNIFRELLIIGNHNSYHSGQLLLFKRQLKLY